MTMRQRIFIIAALVLGCGTVQPTVGSEPKTLTDGFPKPWPNQLRPGPNGKCPTKPQYTIAVNGGCWAWVKVELADCVQAQKEGAYFVASDGRCYYPIFKFPFREPTSSLLLPGAP